MTFRLNLIVGFALLASVADGQAWNRFRGPNGSGVVETDTTIPVTWTEEAFNWKAPLPGPGAGSPVVHNGRVYVTAANLEDGERFLHCHSLADGAMIWRHAEKFTKYKKHRNNSYASSTPAVDELHVYVLWQSKASSPLIAVDHAGKEQWRYELGPYKHGQGGGTSPIVVGDLVVVANDHSEGSFLVALDRTTGREAWRIPREGKRACYATPCVRTRRDGELEIVFSHCFEGVIGVLPKTGKVQWHIDVFGRFAQRAVGSPIVWKDLVLANSGAALGERNLVAIRPDDQGNATEVYRVDRQAPHVPTALVYQDRLYLWSDAGIVSCREAKDGSIVWQARAGGAKYFSSPICVNGKLYNVDANGVVRVVGTGGKFELLGETDLKDDCRSTPAVGGGALLVRTDQWLYSVGK